MARGRNHRARRQCRLSEGLRTRFARRETFGLWPEADFIQNWAFGAFKVDAAAYYNLWR